MRQNELMSTKFEAQKLAESDVEGLTTALRSLRRHAYLPQSLRSSKCQIGGR